MGFHSRFELTECVCFPSDASIFVQDLVLTKQESSTL